MSTIQAIPGQWVEVTVTGAPWPAKMKIGDGRVEPAFVDRVKRGGTICTVVKRRCPDIPSGRHPVRVFLPDGMVEAMLVVPVV